MKKSMKKRFLSLLMAILMVISILPVNVLADGTATEISDQSGLTAMANTAGSYKLMADITLSDWTPVNLASGTTFDGNGHTITLTGTALFNQASSNSTINNLILDGTVTSSSSVGSLAIICNATVRNCASYTDVTYTGTGGSYWPDYAGGLIGSMTYSSTVISNCLYAGTFTHGNAQVYGSIANNQAFVNGKIEKCVGVGSDRIGSTEGLSAHETIAPGTNTVITDSSTFQPEEYLDTFNQNREENDLNWSIKDGLLGPFTDDTAAPEADATAEEIARLNSAITNAASVDRTKIYTTDTWTAFTEALEKAKAIDTTATPKQSVVVNAASALTKAQSGLLERSLDVVEIPEDSVIELTQANFDIHMESPAEGTYYRLTENITIGTYWFGRYSNMNAILDGNGYTITLNGNPLWNSIGANGVIQNLGLKGSASSTRDTGALAESCNGLIINCWSQVNVSSEGMNSTKRNTGGLTGNLKSGGAIINSYVSGSVIGKGSTGTGVTGVLAGNSEENTLIQYGYWLNTVGDHAAGGKEAQIKECTIKSRQEFYSEDFLALLNANKGENGKTWTLNNEGWPHLGAAGSYTPPEPVTLAYTKYEGYGTGTVEFKDIDGITLSLAEVLPDQDAEVNYYVGQFTLPGYEGNADELVWNPIYAADGLGNHKVFVDSVTGELQVIGAGTLEVVVYNNDTEWKELAKFTITVTEANADELRLVPTGEYVTCDDNGNYTVAGSGVITMRPEIKLDGIWKSAPSSFFTFNIDGAHYGSGSTFYATEPGDITVTATGLSQTASATITSTYVPVDSITPGPNGTYVIHGRNANSSSSGDFLDLTLSHGAGTVVIQPENASYRNSWSMTSSDPSVAEYVSSMLVAVLPKKAGTTTLTAAVNDPLADTPATGSSNITLEYFNPLTAITAPSNALTVKENDTIRLPLTFTGTEGLESYYVTEPDMIWTFSSKDGGEVEITRSPLGVILSGDENEYCVANDTFKLTGVSEGTVTVTGTPVDQTNQVAPVTFTVVVESGAAETPVDSEKLAQDAIEKAKENLLNLNTEKDYVYGDEWDIFALIRSGASIPEENMEGYITSILSTYEAPDNEALKPTTIARVALTVTLLGHDASNLDGLNLIEMLYNSNAITAGGNEPMWALIALDSRAYAVADDAEWTRDELITELLTKYQNPETGGFGLNDNITTSIDMTAMAIQALAPYYEREEVKTAVDKALDYLKGAMDRNARFDSSEAGAQVLVALTTLNLDPVDAENGFVKSVARNIISGLCSYQLEDGSFKHLFTDASGQKMSTLQSLYALHSYERYLNGDTTLYDLTDVNPVPEAEEITVSFRLVGDTEHSDGEHEKYVNWIKTVEVTVAEGSTVYDVFAAVLNEMGLEFEEGQYNYISSIQAPFELGAYWLSAFDHGYNSGWKYLVNGIYPEVGLRYYVLEDGDTIVWRYVDDHTDEEDNTDKWMEAPDVDPEENENNKEDEDIKLPFTDVPDSHWGLKAIKYVYKNKLMSGFTDTLFSPETTTSRAMIATILYRQEGRPEVSEEQIFTDVPAGLYYSKAVNWAEANGIVSGYGNSIFGPDDAITREQMASILYRYAKYKGYDTASTGDLSSFDDETQISSYAATALSWAVGNGLIFGRTTSILAPQDTATRAEAASILMRFIEKITK